MLQPLLRLASDPDDTCRCAPAGAVPYTLTSGAALSLHSVRRCVTSSGLAWTGPCLVGQLRCRHSQVAQHAQYSKNKMKHSVTGTRGILALHRVRSVGCAESLETVCLGVHDKGAAGAAVPGQAPRAQPGCLPCGGQPAAAATCSATGYHVWL